MAEPTSRLSRRSLLTGGAVTAVGALAACTPGKAASAPAEAAPTSAKGAATPADIPSGKAVEPFHGPHQAGVATLPQTYAAFVAFDLNSGIKRDAVARMMRLLTDDARRLTSGAGALADTEPHLAEFPARLTVTFGFGPGLFKAAGKEKDRPDSVADLPAFRIDRLQDRWSGGDLLIQLCCDDAVTLAHALRMTVKDARTFGKVRWIQRGFRRPPHVQAATLTQRNLMGQLDGTVNPQPGSADFERAVWAADGPEWFRGGTTLVVRRIRIEMEIWDQVDPVAREFTIGRRLSDGAPLTGDAEHDEPDFDKTNASGLLVIGEYAHIRRAHIKDPGMRILRRPYNYDDGLSEKGHADSGLIFASYQADVTRQFLPIQRSLAEADLLNEWTTPIGSAVFAIPPGCGEDGWIGEGLLA
ncbi:Dyp-type peroxidase [Thermopolyspora sp. NPDC052614]|uniref:Dyp-type peroxidase n=1 Tax=Thermopolyspora sp. NPDC052614 TaxID=3155682 RepID=UPI00341FFCDA